MGPGVSVILRQPLSEQQLAEITAWLSALVGGGKVTIPGGRWYGLEYADGWEIVVEDLSVLGGILRNLCGDGVAFEAEGEPCAFTARPCTVRPGARYFEETGEQVAANLGYEPRHYIGISATCNSRINHRILGYLALHLAEQYGDIIDMHAAIAPPPPPGPLPREGYPWRTLEEISAFVHQLPGRVIELYSVAPDGRTLVSHMLDSQSFLAWLQHPYFYMIK